MQYIVLVKTKWSQSQILFHLFLIKAGRNLKIKRRKGKQTKKKSRKSFCVVEKQNHVCTLTFLHDKCTSHNSWTEKQTNKKKITLSAWKVLQTWNNIYCSSRDGILFDNTHSIFPSNMSHQKHVLNTSLSQFFCLLNCCCILGLSVWL